MKVKFFRGETMEWYVLNTNVGCPSSKTDEFQALIRALKLHIIVITELLPKNCQQPDVHFQQVHNYNLIVSSNYKYGIFIYVHASLK